MSLHFMPPGNPMRVALAHIRLRAPEAAIPPDEDVPAVVEERVVLRFLPGGAYELLAGKAAWMAAKRAGHPDIEAVVYAADDRTAEALALVEQTRRREISPVGEARAILRLCKDHKVRQREIGAWLGRHQSSLSHLLRMLERLVPPVLDLVDSRRLSVGHAKVLMAVDKLAQERWARQCLQGGWSVKTLKQQLSQAGRVVDADLAALERDLTERIGCTVHFEHTPSGRGSIRIDYYSLDEAEGVVDRLREPPRGGREDW